MPAWEKIGLPLAQNRKKSPRNGFWPHRENRGKVTQKLEKCPKHSPEMGFGASFPICGPFFPYFRGEAKIHFSAIFFPILGRRPEPIGSLGTWGWGGLNFFPGAEIPTK